MKHLSSITRTPARAQIEICSNIASDFQARLCFITELLLNFFLPIWTTKFDASTDDET